MKRTTSGLVFGVVASLSFGTSGAFIKPLLEAGWSPAAAVTARTLVAGLILTPVAVIALRGSWSALWRARWRILGMGTIGVASTQLAYFAALERIPISTALLIEYLAPLLLVALVWVRTRRMPGAVVLIGSVVAISGLVLVIGPGAIGAVDPLGLLFAALASVACAGYFLIAARPSRGLPPVALAAAGLLVGSLELAILMGVGVLPFGVSGSNVALFGQQVSWWVPLAIVALVGTSVAYVSSITATERLGSRLASFVGLLEVVFASLFAWLLLGQQLTLLQGLGGALILAGIAFVRAERDVSTEIALADPSPVASTPTIAQIADPTGPVPVRR